MDPAPDLHQDDGYRREKRQDHDGQELPRAEQQPAAGDDHREEHRTQVMDASAQVQYEGNEDQYKKEGQEYGQAYAPQSQGYLEQQNDDGAGGEHGRLSGLSGRGPGDRRQGARGESKGERDVQDPGQPVLFFVCQSAAGPGSGPTIF